ncbi:MAG: Ppx/GppA family phosphatase [Bdellovibrionales bacterium]|nr:Ppx/GppA family phosphatase [Bdellovibrionales bacterium]
MRIAIIDLGTNSIRFDIHEVSASRKGTHQHRRLYREKTMVRLGQDLFLNGKLSEESKRRTLEAALSFHSTMEALSVDRCVAFGTAAIRDASDGETFLLELKKKTGIEFRMITGAEEASLIAKGVLNNQPGLPKGVFALIDIGGGSTEVSICKGRTVLRSHSFNLGVAKLQQVFLKTQPPAQTKKNQNDPVSELRQFIKSVVLPKLLIESWPKAPTIIGSSGSIIALAKLVNRDKDRGNLPFESKHLSKVVEQIKNKTTAELLAMNGMEPKRVDLILAGAILLDELAQMLKAKTIRSTEFALRDGILEDELARITNKKARSSQFSFEEIETRISAWGVDATHANTVREHAEFLFDALKPFHKLKSEWRPYLGAAALLHDSGEVISHAHHAEHSEYMVKNANFVGMHGWEAGLIAGLCRFHKEEKLLEKKNEKKIPYPKKDGLRKPFLTLLALLQMADACDRTHKKTMKLKRIKRRGSTLEIRFASRTPCDLELLRFEQKKSLFEQLFHLQVRLEKSSSK